MSVDAADKFDITVDGGSISKTLRHTFSNGGQAFSLEEELSKLHGECVEDNFYYPDMPVTRYVYSVSGIDAHTGRKNCQ